MVDNFIEDYVKEAFGWLAENGCQMRFRPADQREWEPPPYEEWRAEYEGPETDEDVIKGVYYSEYTYIPYHTLMFEGRIKVGEDTGKLYALTLPLKRDFTEDSPEMLALTIIRGQQVLEKGVRGEL